MAGQYDKTPPDRRGYFGPFSGENFSEAELMQ